MRRKSFNVYELGGPWNIQIKLFAQVVFKSPRFWITRYLKNVSCSEYSTKVFKSFSKKKLGFIAQEVFKSPWKCFLMQNFLQKFYSNPQYWTFLLRQFSIFGQEVLELLCFKKRSGFHKRIFSKNFLNVLEKSSCSWFCFLIFFS